MKRIFGLILCGVLVLGITGCGNNETTTDKNNDNSNNNVQENSNSNQDGNTSSSKTLVCVSEEKGNSQSTKYYQEFVIENNEITEFTRYSIKTYDEEGFSKEDVADNAERYENYGIYEVEKIGDYEIKLTDKDPNNIFEHFDVDDIEALIIETLENQDDGGMVYKCERK